MVTFFEHGLAGVQQESELVRSWWRPELRSFGGFKDADDFPTFAGATKAYATMLGQEHADEVLSGLLKDARESLRFDLATFLGVALNDDLFELHAPAERPLVFGQDSQVPINIEYVATYVNLGATKLRESTRRFTAYSRSIQAITKAAWWGFRFPFATGNDELDAWIHEACDAAEEFSLPETVREEHLWRARLQLRLTQERPPWHQREIAETLISRPLSEKLSLEEFDAALSDAALTY